MPENKQPVNLEIELPADTKFIATDNNGIEYTPDINTSNKSIWTVIDDSDKEWNYKITELAVFTPNMDVKRFGPLLFLQLHDVICDISYFGDIEKDINKKYQISKYYEVCVHIHTRHIAYMRHYDKIISYNKCSAVSVQDQSSNVFFDIVHKNMTISKGIIELGTLQHTNHILISKDNIIKSFYKLMYKVVSSYITNKMIPYDIQEQYNNLNTTLIDYIYDQFKNEITNVTSYITDINQYVITTRNV